MSLMSNIMPLCVKECPLGPIVIYVPGRKEYIHHAVVGLLFLLVVAPLDSLLHGHIVDGAIFGDFRERSVALIGYR